MMKSLLVLSSILALAACGDNLESTRPDARVRADAPPGTPDAPALPDAPVVSTVTVTTGACATADQRVRGVAGQNFEYDDDADGPNAPVTAHTIAVVLNAGDQLEFTTTGQHNFQSKAGTPPEMVFTSGAPSAGGQTACLTFTAAHASIDIECAVHPTMMNGTLVVN